MQSVFSTKDDSAKLSDLQVTVDRNRIRWKRTVKTADSNLDGPTANNQLSQNNNNNNSNDGVLSPSGSWVAEVSLVSSDDEEGLPAADDVASLTPDVAVDPRSSGSGNDVSEDGEEIVFVASVVKTPIETSNADGQLRVDDGQDTGTSSDLSRPPSVEYDIGWQPSAPPAVVGGVSDRQLLLVNGLTPKTIYPSSCSPESPSAGAAVGAVASDVADAVPEALVEHSPRSTPATQVCLRERKAKQQSTCNGRAREAAEVVVNGSPRLSPRGTTRGAIKAFGQNAKRISRDLFNGDNSGPTQPGKRALSNNAPVRTKEKSGSQAGESSSSSSSVLDSPRRIVPPTRWVMMGGDVSMVTSKRNVSPVVAAVAGAVKSRDGAKRRRPSLWRKGIVTRAKRRKPLDSGEEVGGDEAVGTPTPPNSATQLTAVDAEADQPFSNGMDIVGAMTPLSSSLSCSEEVSSSFAPVSVVEPSEPPPVSTSNATQPRRPTSVIAARAERDKLSAAICQLCPGKKKVSSELRDIYEHSVNSAKLAALNRGGPSSSRSTSPRSARVTPPGDGATWWKFFKDISARPRTKRVPVVDGAAALATKKSRQAKPNKTVIARNLPATSDGSAPVSAKKKSPQQKVESGDRVKTKQTKAKEARQAAKKRAIQVATSIKSTREARIAAAAKIKTAVKRKRRVGATAGSTVDKKRKIKLEDKKKTKPVKFTAIVPKKERETVNLNAGLSSKKAPTSSELVLPSPASVMQVVVRKNNKAKDNGTPTFNQFIADSFQSVVSPTKSPPTITVVGTTSVASWSSKTKIKQGHKVKVPQTPLPVNVKSLLKAANDLHATLSTPGKTLFLSVPTGKETSESGLTKGPKSKQVKEEKSAGKTKPTLKDAVKRSSKKEVGNDKALSRLVATMQPVGGNSGTATKRKPSEDGVRLRLAPTARPTVAKRRSMPAQSIHHRQLLSGAAAGLGRVSGYDKVPLTTQQGTIKRSSVRQAECAFRYREIGVKRHSNFIQIVLISNTRVRNGLNAQVLFELQTVLQAAQNDPKCRLVVLNGTGGVFCSGVDLISLSNDQGTSTAEKMSIAVRDFCKTLLMFPKLLVAAVNGSAVGLGVTFLPFFDLVYASDKATFYTPYCKLGQIPECGATVTFPSIMGYAKTNGLLLEGQRLTATEAMGTGLITHVLWPSTFMEEVIPRVQAIANYPIDAVKHTKALVRYHMLSKLEVTLDTEFRILQQQWSTDECREAIRHFLQYEEVV